MENDHLLKIGKSGVEKIVSYTRLVVEFEGKKQYTSKNEMKTDR